MRILAIDTSSDVASIALSLGDSWRGDSWRGGGGHSRELVSRIDRLLAHSGCSIAELDVLAVAVGPGSFTGLRVGLAAAKGLSLVASSIRCVGVSVLEAYAAAVPAAERGPTTRIVALRNGYRNDAFLQEFDGTTEPLGPPRVVPAATLDDEIPPEAVLIGDGASRYAGDIRPLGRRTLPEPEALAEHVGAVAAKRASLSRSGDACPLRPLYVRPVDIGVARR